MTNSWGKRKGALFWSLGPPPEQQGGFCASWGKLCYLVMFAIIDPRWKKTKTLFKPMSVDHDSLA